MADPAVGYDGNPLDPTNGGGSTPTTGTSKTVGDLGSLASLAPLIINMLKGSSQPNPGALLGTIPGGQDLLNSVTGQQQQQAPLRQAVTQQAMNMLPNSAFPGGRPALAPVGAGPAPVQGGGSSLPGLLGAGAAGAGLGALLAKLASGGGASSGGDLGKLAAAIKNLLSGKGSSATPITSGYFDGNGNWVHDASGGGVMPDLPGSGTPLNDPFGGNVSPNVDTSYNFNSDPTVSAYQPPDWSSLPGYGTPLGGGGGNSGDEGGEGDT